MGWVRATLDLYADVFRRGAVLALRNAAVGLVLLVYLALLWFVASLVAPFGIVGGLIRAVAQAACASSGLALVEHAIRSGRVRLADVPGSFTAYLGDVMTIFFILWIVELVFPIIPMPLRYLVVLAGFVFLNAVPELIYLGRYTATDILVESYRFIAENWIEWFPPNVALALLLLLVSDLPAGPFPFVKLALVGVVLYFAMIVRGLLFQELSSSSRRSREFRRRAAS